VTFSATGASSGQPAFSANRCTTGSNGQCQVTVTSTLAGEFTITAAAEGRLPKSATVTWKAGDAAAAKSQLTLASSTLRPGGSTQVKLFVADAYGNPVTGLTKTNAKLSVSSPLALSNDFKAVANQPGNYTMTLKVGTNAKSGVFPVKAQPGSFTLSTELTISSTASTTAAPTASKTTGTTAAPTASETPVIELDWISDLFANFISFFVGLFRIPIKIISIPIIVG
jgi:adhesin/invasin